MNIGAQIRNLRIQNDLTQEELAARCELSKGFISQLENDLTSPSIATLIDILTVLGTDLHRFFGAPQDSRIIFTEKEMYSQELEDGSQVNWLITEADNKAMEPLRIDLEPGGQIPELEPHFSDIFVHIIQGEVTLILGEKKYKLKKKQSFYLSKPRANHTVVNTGKSRAVIMWVSTPPVY